MPQSWGRVAHVMVSPWRHPETGMFWFRKAVPVALRLPVGVVLGRPGKPAWELKWTLGTHSIREAKELMPAALARADAILDAARHGARPLTDREAHALAGLWYQRRLREWEANPAAADGWDGWDIAAPTDPYTEDTEDDAHPVASPHWQREWRTFLKPWIGEAQELLSAESVVTDPASTSRLAELIVKRLPQALETQRRRASGDYSPDTLPATFPAWEPPRDPTPGATSEGAAVSLRGLCTAWKAVAVVKPRTVDEAVYAVEGLCEFLGHDDAARVTRDDLAKWRDALKGDGRSNNTWNNRLSLIRQVFLHGVTERRLASDPTEGLRLRKSRQQSPLPYSDADAARILIAARGETRPSLRWAHWVMAFTGMRAGEVLQLLGGDVRKEGEVWLIDVNERTAGKSVKTGQPRHVPVHPALIAEGFIAYAQTIAAAVPLFPDKRPDRHGNRGGRAWNLIGKWARQKAGITDPEKAPDHSWRHRVEDEMRAAEVPEDARDAIVGHARKTTGRQYGVRGEALKRLHRFLSRIPVPPGVDLPCAVVEAVQLPKA